MAFRCPNCSRPDTLRIGSRLELPSDSRSDEITLQVVECSACSFAAMAVYQESRRGSLDFDSFEHIGYYVSAEVLSSLRRDVRSCPRPSSTDCECAAHHRWGRQDETGRWNALDDVPRGEHFWMEWHRKVG
jgi:Zn ribbon nucleic-acid-binding protein